MVERLQLIFENLRNLLISLLSARGMHYFQDQCQIGFVRRCVCPYFPQNNAYKNNYYNSTINLLIIKLLLQLSKSEVRMNSKGTIRHSIKKDNTAGIKVRGFGTILATI